MPIRTKNSSPPLIYRFLVRLLSLVFFAHTVWRAFKDGGWKYFSERLGYYKASANTEERLWVHAASVGEVITVLPLVNAWLEENSRGVLFTTGTPTGADILIKQNNDRIQHQFLPVDFPGACTRFFKQANVNQGWIVETEIWPWLYSIAAKKNVALSIINGRLSDKTYRQAGSLLGTSYRNALNTVRIFSRSDDDRQKFIALGADANKVEVRGDLKYAANELKLAEKPVLNRPFVLAASTHADEEIRIAQAWINARQDNTLLVIAPRHPERSSEIYDQLCKKGFFVTRRTSNEALNTSHDIYLADTLGELALFYQFAKGAFVGGSLIDRGGHNILEPARYACPTVVGLHTHNFDDMVLHMLKNNALTVAMNENEVAAFFVETGKDNSRHLASAQRAQTVALENQQVVMNEYLTSLHR